MIFSYVSICTYRLELQDFNYENTSSPTSRSVKFTEFDESKEPAYDDIDTTQGTQDVKMIRNPAYSTPSSIKMDAIPA